MFTSETGEVVLPYAPWNLGYSWATPQVDQLWRNTVLADRWYEASQSSTPKDSSKINDLMNTFSTILDVCPHKRKFENYVLEFQLKIA